MKKTNLLMIMLFTLMGGFGLTSCNEKEDAGDKMERAGEDMQDAAEDVGENVEDAAEDAGEEIEDATD